MIETSHAKGGCRSEYKTPTYILVVIAKSPFRWFANLCQESGNDAICAPCECQAAGVISTRTQAPLSMYFAPQKAAGIDPDIGPFATDLSCDMVLTAVSGLGLPELSKRFRRGG